MITSNDMHLLTPETRTLDTNRKDWREHLDKVVRLGDTGTRVVYWEGPTDVDPRGKRKEVFDVVRGYAETGKAHLYQRRVDGGYRYELEVR